MSIPEEFVPTKTDLYKRIRELEAENPRLREFIKDVEIFCDRRTNLHEGYSFLKERAQKALEGKDG